MSATLTFSARVKLALLALIAVFAALMPSAVLAQDADIDWADAGVASFGAWPTGTVVTGSDGTTAQVDFAVTDDGDGTFVPAFGGDFLSFFAGNVGASVSPLLMSFNNQAFDPDDRIVVTITLNRAVTNLNFSINDIDNGNFSDAMEVYYDDDLTGAFSNAATNTAFWTAGPAIARTNNATVNGWTGIAPSDQFTTDGDLTFDFNTQQVRRIQIVYFSNTGTGDPGQQFSTISDFDYDGLTADLSLTKTLLGSPPSNGGFVTWQLVVTSAASSEAPATGIVVDDNLPASFTFDGASGDGSFDSGTGEWTVGTLAPGASATINIQGFISAAAGSTITNTAEVISSSLRDPDSTVNNGVTGEDDFASESFVVAANPPSTPPVLACPAGQSVFDWDAVAWAAGSLNNTYPLSTWGTIEFDIVSTANLTFRASFGGQTPILTDEVSGGLIPTQQALAFNADNDNRSQEVVTTVTLPRVVTGAQFKVFDIDQSAAFQDRVTVFGRLNGVVVNAILTNGNANTISGPSLIGSGGAGDTTNTGDGTFTFLDPIDTIVIEYGNGPGAPTNPGNQSIAIHDFTFCTPELPNISVTKISSVISDPVNGTTNPKAIPGALVEYLITVSNTGPGATDADSVVVTDDGPADAKMCLISEASGPVIFTDPGSNTGLTYNFASIGSGTDDLEFSDTDGSNFGYTPVADPEDGCDGEVTDFRLSPSGAMAGNSTFTLRVRYIVE